MYAVGLCKVCCNFKPLTNYLALIDVDCFMWVVSNVANYAIIIRIDQNELLVDKFQNHWLSK